MFGGPFGAAGTTGCHFFDPNHPTYLRIAAIARLRNANDYVGRTLRMGICYPRETSFCGCPYRLPGAGELFGWSRILADHEVLMVLNTTVSNRVELTVTIECGSAPPARRCACSIAPTGAMPSSASRPVGRDGSLCSRPRMDGHSCGSISRRGHGDSGMNADERLPSEEFLFGRLSTPAGRLDEARQERQGFFDLAVLEPLDPHPGEPIRLRFRCGVDVGLQGVRVFWTADGTRPAWNERLEPQHATQTVDGAAAGTGLGHAVLGLCLGLGGGVACAARGDAAAIRRRRGRSAPAAAVPCPWPDRASPRNAASRGGNGRPAGSRRHGCGGAVIYQVFVDRFAPTPGESFAAADDLDARLGGTLWGLIERLDDLDDLGVDTLWLTPIFASPNYHGYAVSDFFRVEPALGGEAAWQELVAACRERGLRLVLDFVANHVSDQHAAFMAAIAVGRFARRALVSLSPLAAGVRLLLRPAAPAGT